MRVYWEQLQVRVWIGGFSAFSDVSVWLLLFLHLLHTLTKRWPGSSSLHWLSTWSRVCTGTTPSWTCLPSLIWWLSPAPVCVVAVLEEEGRPKSGRLSAETFESATLMTWTRSAAFGRRLKRCFTEMASVGRASMQSSMAVRSRPPLPSRPSHARDHSPVLQPTSTTAANVARFRAAVIRREAKPVAPPQ